MPLPAGYTLDSGTGGKPPAGYTVDSDYAPPGANATTSKASLVSDALKYSPVGAVKGIADMLRSAAEAAPGAVKENANAGPLAPAVALAKGVGKTIQGSAQQNVKLWDKAKESFKNGDYAAAAGHFLSYLLPGGQAAEDIGGDIQKGDYSHAAAKTAGLVSNFGVPAVMEGITSPAVARVPGAVVEGLKAAAPDVAAGAAKAAAGEVLAKVPGLEWPARVGVQYPAVRQMKAGATTGVKAFKAALQDKIQAVVDNATETERAGNVSRETSPPQKLLNSGPIVTPPPADASFVRGEAQEWSPSQGKWVPKGTAPDAVAAPAQPAAPAAPQTPTVNPEAAQLDAIAQAGVFGKKYKSFAAAPAEAQATIRGVVEGMKPKVNAPEAPADIGSTEVPVSRETSPPASSEPANLRDMMRNLPAEAARAEFLRQREAGTTPAKAVADGLYAQGEQTQAEAGATYEAAARSDKAQRLAKALHQSDINSGELEPHEAAELVKMLAPAAKAVGIKAPSAKTIPEVLFHLKRLEAAKATGAQ